MIHDRHDTLVWIVAQTCPKFGGRKGWRSGGRFPDTRRRFANLHLEGQLESEVRVNAGGTIAQTSNA